MVGTGKDKIRQFDVTSRTVSTFVGTDNATGEAANWTLLCCIEQCIYVDTTLFVADRLKISAVPSEDLTDSCDRIHYLVVTLGSK